MSNIFYIALGVIIVILIIGFVIRKIKEVIFLIIFIVIGVCAYSIVVDKVSPMDAIQNVSTNANYTKDIALSTVSLSKSVSGIQAIVKDSKIDTKELILLKTESQNISNQLKSSEKLKHSKVLNGFHTSYISKVKLISSSCNTLVSIGNKTQKGSISEVSSKLQSAITQLKELDINKTK